MTFGHATEAGKRLLLPENPQKCTSLVG